MKNQAASGELPMKSSSQFMAAGAFTQAMKMRNTAVPSSLPAFKASSRMTTYSSRRFTLSSSLPIRSNTEEVIGIENSGKNKATPIPKVSSVQ
ncbi:hypothetical protein D3C73_1552500 [compost metagenome]